MCFTSNLTGPWLKEVARPVKSMKPGRGHTSKLVARFPPSVNVRRSSFSDASSRLKLLLVLSTEFRTSLDFHKLIKLEM